MQSEIVKCEQKAIRLGIVGNVVMAISGWVAFNLSGSQALLLDGNMSFILFLTSIAALKISAIKNHRSDQFPFGLFVTEALYAFMKGLLLLGIIIAALTTNGSKILQFYSGELISPIKTGVIVYYAIAMVVICWGLSFYYHLQNRKIQMSSGLLKVDQKSSFIDGVLSASTGAILIVIGYVPQGSSFDFLLYIGDALLVIVLAVLMMGQPVRIIKQAFIELVGGKLQDQEQYLLIKKLIDKHFAEQDISISAFTVSKTGSSYLVVLAITQTMIAAQQPGELQLRKQAMKAELLDHFSFVDLEIVVD